MMNFLSKSRAGIFILLIAVSMYSIFMISASNTSYAASGPGFFKFSALFGLSPSGNGYDNYGKRNRNESNGSKTMQSNIIPSTDAFSGSTGSIDGGMSSMDLRDIKNFLSSNRTSSFRGNNNSNRNNTNSRGSNGRGGSSFLPSVGGIGGSSIGGGRSPRSCLEMLDLGNLTAEQIIQCIADNGDPTDGNPVDPFDNPGNGGNPFDNGGNPFDNGGGPGNGGGPVIAEVPEPSTYMLLGLGMMTLVGFSRKKKIKAFVK